MNGTKEDRIVGILMDTNISCQGDYEKNIRDKAKEIIKYFKFRTNLDCISILSIIYIELRLSLGLVNMKSKPFDYFLDDLNKAIMETSKMNTYDDLFLEYNIKYLEKLVNMDRNDSKLIEKEISRRKDSLADYEHFVRKKIKNNE